MCENNIPRFVKTYIKVHAFFALSKSQRRPNGKILAWAPIVLLVAKHESKNAQRDVRLYNENSAVLDVVKIIRRYIIITLCLVEEQEKEKHLIKKYLYFH